MGWVLYSSYWTVSGPNLAKKVCSFVQHRPVEQQNHLHYSREPLALLHFPESELLAIGPRLMPTN